MLHRYAFVSSLRNWKRRWFIRMKSCPNKYLELWAGFLLYQLVFFLFTKDNLVRFPMRLIYNYTVIVDFILVCESTLFCVCCYHVTCAYQKTSRLWTRQTNPLDVFLFHPFFLEAFGNFWAARMYGTFCRMPLDLDFARQRCESVDQIRWVIMPWKSFGPIKTLVPFFFWTKTTHGKMKDTTPAIYGWNNS